MLTHDPFHLDSDGPPQPHGRVRVGGGGGLGVGGGLFRDVSLMFKKEKDAWGKR